jgi:hypothetical protein
MSIAETRADVRANVRAKLDALQAECATPTASPPAATDQQGSQRQSLCSILDDVFAYLNKYVVLAQLQTIVLSLWVAHTHAIEAADATPYIHVTSPEPECGKTRLLEILVAIVARPWMTAYTTKATLVRKVDRQQPTLLLDELDAALKTDQEYVENCRRLQLSTPVWRLQHVLRTERQHDRSRPDIQPKICGIAARCRGRLRPINSIALKRQARSVARWRDARGARPGHP